MQRMLLMLLIQQLTGGQVIFLLMNSPRYMSNCCHSEATLTFSIIFQTTFSLCNNGVQPHSQKQKSNLNICTGRYVSVFLFCFDLFVFAVCCLTSSWLNMFHYAMGFTHKATSVKDIGASASLVSRHSIVLWFWGPGPYGIIGTSVFWWCLPLPTGCTSILQGVETMKSC